MGAYNYKGVLQDNEINYPNNILFNYFYNSDASTRYSVIRVLQTKLNGQKQYPFARRPATKKTAHELIAVEGWSLAINAAINDGIIIENGVVITDTTASRQTGVIPLTIDSQGTLGYCDSNTTGIGQTLVNNGIVSALCGFFPIIVDYDDFDYPTDIPDTFTNANWVHCQRQVIGQFGNGDYCIITGEGRGYYGSTGFTIPQLQDLCKSLDLKFAYNLDGGGSTQTAFLNKNVNTIYEISEKPTGRPIDTLIAFNGMNSFSIPAYN